MAAAKKKIKRSPRGRTTTTTTTTTSKRTSRINPQTLASRGYGDGDDRLDAIRSADDGELDELRAMVAAQAAELDELRAAADQAVALARAESCRRARIGRAARRAGFRTPEDWVAWCEARNRDPERLGEDDLDRIRRAAELRSRGLGDP